MLLKRNRDSDQSQLNRSSEEFEVYHSDCIEWMHSNTARQFDLAVFSPPFSSLYTYSKHLEDMGNSRESDDEFMLHFKFFTDALFPLIKDGRNVCVHVQNPSRSVINHGYIGIWDMRGEMIRLFERSGFYFYGEVTIEKNPQAQSIRTKTQCLSFTQFVKDSLRSRPALADYLLIFKKGTHSHVPCTSEKQKNTHGAWERKDITNDDWINWANPIWQTSDDGIYLPYQTCWHTINETDTLNYRMAKTDADERHLCPLQLDLIERCIRLWSNPGEVVFSPFAGIGSELYQALLWNRRCVGIELKKEYFDIAKQNCLRAIKERGDVKCQQLLFR